HISFQLSQSYLSKATFRFMPSAKRHTPFHARCQKPRSVSQKPRISSRPKNLPAQTSGPLKQSVAFDIFSETERGFWQAGLLRLKQNVTFDKQSRAD
ncbi:hypothetical protein, partial [Atopobium sp. oral taxon 810]|uniref:hypothetical protein n=1 Tax=Atopobium sp. oral taxon 810 TaxID=712158 RepID=UPI001E2D8303